MHPAERELSSELLGTSEALGKLRERLAQVAPTPLPVLVWGETGTGKEVVARELHRLSGRRGPFVPVDCAALSSSLIEAELFGHERGAFTGAHQSRDGLVAAARGGTFFLDEIGDLPLPTQTRLLRLLDEGTFRPVGSEARRTADIRVVAATWRDLASDVATGEFRRDLYHRLAVVELHLPPLRERPDDVETLFFHFLDEAAADAGRAPPRIDPSVVAYLRAWPWPGNVRELRNAASYLGAMAPTSRVGVEDLPHQLLREAPDMPASAGSERRPGPRIRTDLPYMDARRVWLDDFQQRYVEAILDEHGGNVSAAARAAGMDRRSIQRILKRGRHD